MATKDTKKNNKTVKQKAADNTKTNKAQPVEEQIPRSKVVKFSIGMVLLFASLFLILAFSSYIYSGSEDASICEGWLHGDNIEGLRVKNAGGRFGLFAAYMMINNGFGLASYIIPAFTIMIGLWLIGVIKPKLLPVFVKVSILMIWLSFVCSVVSKWCGNFIGTSIEHVRLGGNCGDSLLAKLNESIGEIGVFCALALSTLFIVVYYSVLTIDKIVSYINALKQAKQLGKKLRDKVRHKSDAESEDAADDNADDDTEDNQKSDTDTTFTDPEKSTTLVYDADGNLIDGGKDQVQSMAEKQGDEIEMEITGGTTVDLNDSGTDDKSEQDIATAFDTAVKANQPEEGATDDALGFTISTSAATEKGDGGIERGDIQTPYDPKLDLEYYEYPPLSLLEHREDSTPLCDLKEQTANKERIIHVLKSFGVEISSIKATIGPTITLYEITPAEGMRINKIRNLEDDIALSLAAKGIRIIAPIPGKGTIGIEVPNMKKCVVSMESVLNSKTFQESKMELPCAMGKTITNEVFMVDLAKAPHMLVAGATGQGKSVGLNAIITSLLYKKHPTELKMVMVDPKKVEFSVYAPIANQFLAKLEDEEDAIITDNQRVVKTLTALCKLMDDRYMLLKRAAVRNIKEYNKKFKERKLSTADGHDYMPYYVVVIDEFGDLIMTAGKEIELPICRIAQLARAVGIHMIIATQRPTTRIITGTIKANFPARVAFKVSAMMDSRIILDRPGANQLIGCGDMLYLQNADPVRVQCAFVDTPEVNRICEFISQQQKFPEMTYLPEPPMDDEAGGNGKDVDMQNLDPMFAEAAQLIVSQNAGSTSLIQRKFSIGYNRAGRLMDQLEKAGVVGPQIGSKPREVLIQDLLTLDSLLNTLNLN